MRKDLPRKERPYHSHQGVDAGEFRRDAAYQNWRSRGTRDWLLILTVAGAGRVGTDEMEVVCEPGTITLYEPGSPQYYYTDPRAGRWHLLWAHFYPRPHWMPWLGWERVQRGVRVARLDKPEAFRGTRLALDECVRHCRADLPAHAEFALNALERALLWVHSSASHPEVDVRVRKAMDILLEEIRAPFSLSALAARSGLSVSRLTQLFSQGTGLTPQRYLESLRLRRASHLLRSTDLAVAEIAADSGYQDAFYFSNRFRRAFGASPSEFRRHRGSGQEK